MLYSYKINGLRNVHIYLHTMTVFQNIKVS